MYPLLLQLGPIKIYSYGVMIATAFLVGISLAAKEAKRQNVDPQKIMDLCFYILLSTIIGSRLLFVIINYQEFIPNPLKIFMIWEGGLVFYGGFIGGVITVIFFLKKNNMGILNTLDILAPSVALGQSIGRWGCFFAGCCYGKPTDIPWAIVFNNELTLAPKGVHIHPTQIYASLSGLIIFSILIFLRKNKSFNGQLFWTYGILYSIGRGTVEFFRGDERGFIFDGAVSTSQLISTILLILSVYMFFFLKRKSLINRKT